MQRYLTIVLFLHCITAGAQEYFNQVYDVNLKPEVGFSILPDSDSTLLFAGVGWDTSNLHVLWFQRLESNGNMVWSKQYGKPQEQWYAGLGGSLTRTSDGTFAIGCGYLDSTGTAHGMLVKINKDGDTLWTASYGNGTFNSFNDCNVTTDGGFILTGSTSATGAPVDLWIVKTDSLGHVQWSKSLGHATKTDVGITGIQLSDGNYLFSGYRYVGVSPNGNSNYDHIVYKTDSLGNVIWDRQYGLPESESGYDCIEALDGGYLLVGTFHGSFEEKSQGEVRKLDTAGNTMWHKTYGTPDIEYLRQILQLHDGSIVLAGTVYQGQSISVPYHGWLIKTDASGDSIWSRSYHHNNSHINYFHDVRSTPDGGFVMTGVSMQTTQDAWVVKVDSMGCEIPLCAVGTEEPDITSVEKLHIYPNPASTKLYLELMNNEGGFAEVVDVSGKSRAVLQVAPGVKQAAFDVGSLPPGLYILLLHAGQQVVTQKFVIAR